MEIVMKAQAVSETQLDIEPLINTYGQAILRYCHLLLRDYHEAQDAVQTTFFLAFKKGRITGEPAPWLYKIAYNHCIDILRKRKRLNNYLDKEKNIAKQSYCMNDGMSDEIKAALGKLSPQDRALVINRLIDDMSYDELAQVYNINAATLRQRYVRAKQKLAQALREQGLEDTHG